MFAVGGAQGLVILARPHWSISSPGIVLSVAILASLAAPLTWLLRHHFRPWTRQVALVSGTAATSLAVYGCGAQPSSMSGAYLYFLVVLYAAAYFRPVVAAGHVGLVGASYAVVLLLRPTSAALVQWIQAMSEFVVVALIVAGFASYVRGAAAALAEQAFRDALTGLANRARFLDRLDHALADADRRLTSIAILFMDLDEFKQVNDTLGHPIGDQLLIAAARRLASITPATATLARLGGDEFALLIDPSPTTQVAEDVAAEIVAAFEAPLEIGSDDLTIGISVGIAVRGPGGDAATDVLRNADLAMYEAKRNGKGRYEIARAGMQDEALAHLRLVSDLRRALEEGQFEVFYQPIVAAGTGLPIGAEALVRWWHPQRGLVMPDQFIAAAEASGIILPLGAWVLREACTHAQAWLLAGGVVDETFYVSVNVSPRQLSDPTFVDTVRGILRESGLASSALVLEITESSLMSDFDAGLARLRDVKQLGLRIALDDYGTGYSSMSRLRQLPVDIVKIDKSFVDDLADTGEAAALVRSIVDVTHALGIQCIAEGVETRAQYRILQDLGCDAIQGRLFAPAAPASRTGVTLQNLAAVNGRVIAGSATSRSEGVGAP